MEQIAFYMKKICHALLLVMIFCSCEKEKDTGSLLITVSHGPHVISRAIVYLKAGRDTAQILPPLKYLKVKSVDASGQVFFDHLPEGFYTIWAKGFDAIGQRYVSGMDSILIGRRTHVNEYRVVINTK